MDMQDASGRSPLHVAVRDGASCSTVESLASPSNRDMQDIQGRSPLHDALCYEDYDSENLGKIVSILVCINDRRNSNTHDTFSNVVSFILSMQTVFGLLKNETV